MSATAFPPVFDFTLPAGDSVTLNLTIKDSDSVVIDLTGFTAKWSAQKFYHASTRINKTIGSGITIIDAAAGQLDVVVAQGDITRAGVWFHELELVDDAGESQTVLNGKIDVIRTLNPAT